MGKQSSSKAEIIRNEQIHFSSQKNIWQWATTKAGKKRYDNRLNLFKRYCHPEKSEMILEIGCGDGEFTRRLAGLDATLIASDITFEVLKRAAEKNKSQKAGDICFEMDDAEFLSIKDNSLDFVSGISILHHLDYRKALKECRRVLKEGGQIFFSEPNRLNPITLTLFSMPILRKVIEASPNEQALLRWEMENYLKEIGFKEVRVINNDFLFPWIPDFSINAVEWLGRILEKTPLVKEISGSLIIHAIK
jgi:ubiquinone/menaquinone biosynthesis C-methylase UbiE